MLLYSQLLRRSTARGSSTELVPVGPTKVRVRKSILFTERTLGVEIKNTCLIQLVHLLFYLTLLKCSTQWQSFHIQLLHSKLFVKNKENIGLCLCILECPSPWYFIPIGTSLNIGGNSILTTQGCFHCSFTKYR